jgi:GGDEF domain-containing protein
LKVLLWTHDSSLDSQVTKLVSQTGGIVFRARGVEELLDCSRREQPLLILLGPGSDPEELKHQVELLASHPDTRWIPIVVLDNEGLPEERLPGLLDRGAASVVNCGRSEALLEAQFRALHRTALRLASLRNTRLTDEKTGFYHQSFLLDQLQVLCRKNRRDGIPFCLLFLELRGQESEVHKAALNLSNTVRGADLFGRWEGDLFAVLLPSSQPTQALLLARRCLQILSELEVSSKAALISSDSAAVEAEALVENALNTLDEAWNGEHFLWTWDGESRQPVPCEP